MALVAGDYTWNQWVNYPSWYATTGTWTTATASTTADRTWFNWTGNATAATATTITYQDAVWSDWQHQGWIVRDYGRMETIEQREARLVREQEARDRAQAAREEASRRALADKVRMEGAQERAMELLLMIMTPEERVWHDQHDEIMVRADSGRLYVIEKRGVHGNIREVDEHGCILGRVCVAPGMYDQDAHLHLPLADGWVGQYLAAKHNEEELRARGNWSSRGVCKQPNVPILGRVFGRAA